jgi:hypothetical protein
VNPAQGFADFPKVLAAEGQVKEDDTDRYPDPELFIA